MKIEIYDYVIIINYNCDYEKKIKTRTFLVPYCFDSLLFHDSNLIAVCMDESSWLKQEKRFERGKTEQRRKRNAKEISRRGQKKTSKNRENETAARFRCSNYLCSRSPDDEIEPCARG